MKIIILIFSFVFIGVLFTGCRASLSPELSEPVALPNLPELSEKEKQDILKGIFRGEGFRLSNDSIYLDKKYAEDRNTKLRSDLIEDLNMEKMAFKRDYPLILSEYVQLKPKITVWIKNISGLKPKYSFINTENIDPKIMKKIEESFVIGPSNVKDNPTAIYSDFINYSRRYNIDIDNYLSNVRISTYTFSSDYVCREGPVLESASFKRIGWDSNKDNFLEKDEKNRYSYYKYIMGKDLNNLIIDLKDGISYKYLPDTFSGEDENVLVTFNKVNNSNYYNVIITNKKAEYITVKSVSFYMGQNIIADTNSFKISPYARNLSNKIEFKINSQYQSIYEKLKEHGFAVEYEINGKIKTLLVLKQNY